MNAQGIEILDCLKAVDNERLRRAGDPALAAAVHAVKAYQHDRFTRTYADLLRQPRYASAARFFLEELYGPRDFGQRDSQFARIVPALVRLFPRELIETVRSLARLHSLSERLDTAMGEALRGSNPILLGEYAKAWRMVGSPQQREQQIALMLDVGGALDRYTRNPLLRHSLRMMRGPAQMAGVGVLQTFLERGFDTFRELRGASSFLDTIASRERTLAVQLFAGEEDMIEPGSGELPTGPAVDEIVDSTATQSMSSKQGGDETAAAASIDRPMRTDSRSTDGSTAPAKAALPAAEGARLTRPPPPI